VPLENRILAHDLVLPGPQAARSYSLIRPLRTGFRLIWHVPGSGCGDAGAGVTVRDALVDTLMGPGGVVVLLVVGQDSAQVRLVQDKDSVQELPAQGADQAVADRVHPRCLYGGAQDRGAGGLEDGIEGRGEVRPAVTDEKPEVPEPVAKVQGDVAGLLHCPGAGRVSADAADVHPAGAVLEFVPGAAYPVGCESASRRGEDGTCARAPDAGPGRESSADH
jgi:hypothetical protein